MSIIRTTDTPAEKVTDSRARRFFKTKGDDVWNTVTKVLILTAVIYVIETLSYFVIAEFFGNLAGVDHTANLQLPVDRIIPWFTPLLVVYIPWPFIWYLATPIVILVSNGKEGFALYTTNALMMYVVGSLVYALFPTTTTPADFIDGTIMSLSASAPFYDTLVSLSQNPDNIWGSFPSYHNYWASLFVLFALAPKVKWYYRYPMIIMGLLISLATLMLHQHCLMDVVLTYAMTGLFLAITIRFKLDKKLLAWFLQTQHGEPEALTESAENQ
ncbi:MAG: phosphatase PAP2 family protein [Coriobacteriales bacterium]|jgi:hypothetical protein|nr:phosphatase PAP2 family protein [Coriobacteriales bacterium]